MCIVWNECLLSIKDIVLFVLLYVFLLGNIIFGIMKKNVF